MMIEKVFSSLPPTMLSFITTKNVELKLIRLYDDTPILKQSNILYTSLTKGASWLWYVCLDIFMKILFIPSSLTCIPSFQNSLAITIFMYINYISSFTEPLHDGCTSIVENIKSPSNYSTLHPWSFQKNYLNTFLKACFKSYG
jgi:hypothetical protein